jgi:hypothetical protein
MERLLIVIMCIKSQTTSCHCLSDFAVFSGTKNMMFMFGIPCYCGELATFQFVLCINFVVCKCFCYYLSRSDNRGLSYLNAFSSSSLECQVTTRIIPRFNLPHQGSTSYFLSSYEPNILSWNLIFYSFDLFSLILLKVMFNLSWS